ncbi:DUF4003 family protein [Bacillus sp. CH30_1T]|uniref:DUF4003 family protein n=1 Tax=Bacillus sp. CH30_1T TaxID=2604836 RepID=UPI0011EDA8DF|nr:DUF4003 family protein [Bacillus sp. CH30_1T]KAA0561515.1 DUF4003 family protein [Bacillus sp. CH30_1T]
MEDVMSKVKEYKDIYSQLKKRLRWKVSDSRSIMMVASLYVTNERAFDLDRFVEFSDYIWKMIKVKGNRSETSIPPPYKSKFMLPFKSNFNWEWIH